MTQTKKLPLLIAIFININIVVGAGFFLSSSQVFKTSGLLAPLPWLFCGLLLFPLVKVLAYLSTLYPTAGGLYVYAKRNLGEFWGFISGWGYFIGTLAGNAIVLHAFSSMMKKMGMPLLFASYVSPHTSQLLLDIFFVLFFTGLNMLNITIFERLHIGFTILKAIPLGLVVIATFFLFDIKNLTTAPVKAYGFIENMPIVLFAYLGIEACCAITHNIQDGKKNAAKAMLISLGLIMAIYTIVQFGLLAIVGVKSANPFFDVIPLMTSNPLLINVGNATVKLAILSSYLGGFYGMFYANSWNLYALAKEKRIVASSQLIKLNKHNTPWLCILIQGAIIALLLAIAAQSPATLMTMSGFGVVIAYILSTVTYFIVGPQDTSKFIIGTIALIGCLMLLILCINDLFQDGIQYLLPFLALLMGGFLIYKKA